VRIVDGPLAEFAARVERVDSKDRLKVFIETLRGMSVLVSDTLVELIQGSP
jgi:transcription antitermination factor NusG